MPEELQARCRRLAEALDLAPAAQVRSVTPLTGGVASDIAVVDLGDRRVCMKFALPKLKVAADWHAPVHRNAAEYAWLQVAARIAPQSAVRLFGRSEQDHGFAMEFLDGDDILLWKAELLAGRHIAAAPGRVGDLLGRIHAVSARGDFDRGPFNNRDDFRALRIEPYLGFTASNHPQVAAELTALADMLYTADAVLVHGDVSPKNILLRGGNPIILDAECATMGDPCFDLAFCLNHLVLKALHVPVLRPFLAGDVTALWSAYAAHVDWEPATALQERVCRLLPALMLARVDGKSPVEYLTPATGDWLRNNTPSLIRQPKARLDHLINELQLDECT